MEHQYPGAISGDENMLAELMLPDQAHERKEDWTVFFLHKDTGEVDEGREEGKEGGGATKESGEEADDAASSVEDEKSEQTYDPADAEGPPLIYVLNLVNVKYDLSVKRYVNPL